MMEVGDAGGDGGGGEGGSRVQASHCACALALERLTVDR